jgi:hypothetical protein
MVASTSALAAAMLQLTLHTDDAAAREVQARIDGLTHLQTSPEEIDSIRNILARARRRSGRAGQPVLFCAGEHRSIANVTTLRRSEIEL